MWASRKIGDTADLEDRNKTREMLVQTAQRTDNEHN